MKKRPFCTAFEWAQQVDVPSQVGGGFHQAPLDVSLQGPSQQKPGIYTSFK